MGRELCPDTCTRYTETIMSPCLQGIGPVPAKIMLIGEAPGQVEDKHGEPFVGSSGRLLDELLEENNLNRKELYITNCVKCATKGENRTPTKKEIKCCRNFLVEEIKQVKPMVIAAIGGKALESVLGKSGITKIKNQVYFSEEFQTKVVVIYHPAYALRNPGLLPDLRNGFKLLAKEATATEIIGTEKMPAKYLVADTKEKIQQVLSALEKISVFAMDFETTSLNYLNANIVCISVSWAAGSGITVPWNCLQGEERERLLTILASDKLKIGQNIKYDIEVAIHNKIKIRGPFFDVMLAHSLIDENSKHSLDDLTLRYLDMGEYWAPLEVWKKERSKTLGEDEELNYGEAPKELLFPYAAKDADATYRLYPIFKEKLEKQELIDFFRDHTMPMMESIIQMEYHGVLVDREKLGGNFAGKFDSKSIREVSDEELKKYGLVGEYTIKAKEVEKEIYTDAAVKSFEDKRKKKASSKLLAKFESSKTLKTRYGTVEAYCEKMLKDKDWKINLNSPKQLGELLFGKDNLNLEITKVTDKNKPSVDAEVLEHFAEHATVPFAKALGNFRVLGKYLSTFLIGIYNKTLFDGRIHAEYLQAVAVTGRLTCKEPNLQQTPRNAKDLKSCLLADPGFSIVKSDLAQAEFRCWAHYSNDEDMIQDIESGMDIHRRIASEIFGIPEEKIAKDSIERTAAKNCVSADTWIPTNTGFEQIYNIRKGDIVLDHLNRCQTVLETINKFDDVYLVNTECGSIKCTKDHPFYTINSEGKLITKPLKELSSGDYILSCTTTNKKKDYITWKFTGKRVTSFKPIFDKWTLDPEMGYLLGFILAEGSIDADVSHINARWSQKGKYVEQIDYLSKKIFGKRVKQYVDKRTGVITWIVTSLEFVEFLKSLGMCTNNKKGFKTFPYKIFMSPIDVQKEFIQGYFLGDGTFKHDRACMGTVSKEMCDDLCLLLRSFGIYPKITVEHPKGGSVFYNIQITNVDELSILINIIGIKQPEGWKYPKFVRGRKFLHNVNKFYHDRHTSGDVRYGIRIRKKLTHLFLKRFCLGIDETLDTLIKNNIYSVKINSIEHIGVLPVYDFVTTGDKVMVANGFYTLDCVFGLMYGRGPAAISAQYGITVEQAQEIKNLFFARYPKAKRWLQLMREHAHAFKQVQSWLGRIRRLPMIDSDNQGVTAEAERQAMNAPIQSLASDMNNHYMCKTLELARNAKIKCYPVTIIHDANIFEVIKGKELELSGIMKHVVETAFPDFRCKMKLDFEIGETLGTLKEVKI